MTAFERTAAFSLGISLTAKMETFWRVVVKGTVKSLYTVTGVVKHLYDVRPSKRSGF